MNLRSPFLLSFAFLLSLIPAVILLLRKESYFHLSFPTSFPKTHHASPQISFPTPIHLPVFPAEIAKHQIAFYYDAPHPMAPTQNPSLQVHFLECKEQVLLSSQRIGLQWTNSTTLRPSSYSDFFWLEVKQKRENQLIASISYVAPDNTVYLGANWESSIQEAPFRLPNEFSETDPFRELAHGSFGIDLLAKEYRPNSAFYRIELGVSGKAEAYLLKIGDWLVFKDNHWQPMPLSEAGDCPIARLKKFSSDKMEIEGWKGASYIRFQLPTSPLPYLKINGDEWLSQLRVRSEKQISCMLDKQCLVLRAADWVLKQDQRWKIIRKMEEKELILQGKMKGDLLVLDRIDVKGPLKKIYGRYFSSNHLQMFPIEKSMNLARHL